MITRRIAAALAAAALALTGCASEEGTQAGGTGHNEADVAFATDMIPHHSQAQMMVDMTLGRDLDPRVRRLTEEIRTTQVAEIEKMADWLEDWGEPLPETPNSHTNAHGEGMKMHLDMPGAMSPQELRKLDGTRGDAFQDMWLRMMIEHHEGAIEMAEVEQEDGAFEPAVKMADKIERTQTAQIEQMEELLDS